LTRASLVVIGGLAALAASGMPALAQSGYWQLQPGSPTLSWGATGANEREWNAQGTTIVVEDAGAASAIIRKTAVVSYKNNIMRFKVEWKAPAQVIPGQPIGATQTATVLEVNYGTPEFPHTFEVPSCQWTGVGGTVMISNGADIQAKTSGQASSKTGTELNYLVRGPDPGTVGGPAKLVFAIPTGYSGGLRATFNYAWAGGAPPAVTTAAPAPAAAPAVSPGSLAGNWNADFNGYRGSMEFTQAGAGWRGRFNIGSGWEDMVNLQIRGTSITFDRVAGSQRYQGQIGPNGLSGTFTWEGNPYKWSATRPAGSAPPAAAPASAAPAERDLFFNGNDGGVSNGGRSPAVTFPSAVTATYIMTYHWNNGGGSPRGGTIALLHENGTMYGPWPVTVVRNVYWEVRPNVKLPAGKYQVIDSEPSSWAQNGNSQGFGHVRIKGY
jgi:hypothetical protein